MLYIALAAAAGLIGFDQLTKILVDSNMQLHQSIPIISFGDTNVLNITYERNPGAAFSILEGKQLFLILFTAVVIVVMLYLMLSKRVKKPTYIWSMSLIVAGGIGNLIDRAVLGATGLLLFVIIDEIKEQANKKKAKKDTAEDEEKLRKAVSDNAVNEQK